MRPASHRHHHRTDIEGLRSVAVLLVLLYHAGLSWFGGGFVGVDVFFVLSGFLITGILLRELETIGTIELLRFYAKRARRLLPASFAVLVFVSVVVFVVPRWAPNVVTPQLYGRSISWDIQRSALYIVNWLFAERSVDYHGGSTLASPVQHFWSLSIEEQFYAVWPVVMLSTSMVFARSKRALAVVLVAITLASLGYSIRLTQTSPDQAYFVTTARAWELSLGGLGALAVPGVNRWGSHRLATPIASVGVTAGLVAIVASAMTIDAGTAFPGTAALVPTLGTLGVLLAAPLAGHSRGVRWLSAQSLQWLGARSYSLYLWHWPVLWLGVAILGPTPVGAGRRIDHSCDGFIPVDRAALAKGRLLRCPAIARPCPHRGCRDCGLCARCCAAGYHDGAVQRGPGPRRRLDRGARGPTAGERIVACVLPGSL